MAESVAVSTIEIGGRMYETDANGMIIVPKAEYGVSRFDELLREDDSNNPLVRLDMVSTRADAGDETERAKNAVANEVLAKRNAEREKIAASITK